MDSKGRKVGLVVVAAALAAGVYGFSQISSKPVTVSNKPTPHYTAPKEAPKPGFNYVTHVVDGDTIDVDIDGKTERIRLIGIDTPETVDPRKPVQCFGKEASNKTKEMLSGKQVRLEADPTQDDRDKYGRLLRYVFLEDGTNYNQWLVVQGYAHEYTYDIPYKYQAEFKAAERQAQNLNRGLWSAKTCNGITK